MVVIRSEQGMLTSFSVGLLVEGMRACSGTIRVQVLQKKWMGSS